MLPWRRRKIVLVEEETKTKPKSLGMGTGGTYGSIVWSLVCSFPDLLPDRPFKQVGKAFRSRRQTVELNRDDPVYTVQYLGSMITLSAKGEGCTEEAVGKIWSRSDYGGQGARMKLTVGAQGIRLGPENRRKPCHLFYLHRITCCAADPRRPKIFAWVYRHQVKNKAVVLRCHAVLVARAEKARAMALSLSQAAASAFAEFKRLKRQSDLRHVRQQLLGEAAVPLVPIRKLLNGQCHYQPAADRCPAAARLCAIAEEEEEEEEDEGGEREKQLLLDGHTAHSGKDATDSASLRSDTTLAPGPSAAG